MAGFDLISHWYILYEDLEHDSTMKIDTNYDWKHINTPRKAPLESEIPDKSQIKISNRKLWLLSRYLFHVPEVGGLCMRRAGTDVISHCCVHTVAAHLALRLSGISKGKLLYNVRCWSTSKRKRTLWFPTPERETTMASAKTINFRLTQSIIL